MFRVLYRSSPDQPFIITNALQPSRSNKDQVKKYALDTIRLLTAELHTFYDRTKLNPKANSPILGALLCLR